MGSIFLRERLGWDRGERLGAGLEARSGSEDWWTRINSGVCVWRGVSYKFWNGRGHVTRLVWEAGPSDCYVCAC